MKTLQEQIIAKQDELIEFYELLFNGDTTQHIHEAKLKKELSALKAQAEQESNNRQQSEDSANNLKTAEEILKGEMSENLWTFICSYPVSYKSEEKLVEWIIDAMQEYAAQFKAEKEKPIINLINNIECFAQILGKHCVDNKVSLTSNERHTIYDAFKEYIFQIEAEQEVDLNTPFFGNSGAKVPLTEAIITEEINKASLQHSENPENDIYYTAGYRDAIRDFRQKAEQEKVTDETIDLQQYVTNCFYYSHVEAQSMSKDEFDKWVEREVDNITEYLNKEKVTDEDIINYALEYISHKSLKPANKGLIKDALIIGAKAHRDKLITHNK